MSASSRALTSLRVDLGDYSRIQIEAGIYFLDARS